MRRICKIICIALLIGVGISTISPKMNISAIEIVDNTEFEKEREDYYRNMYDKIHNAYLQPENSMIYDIDGNDITAIVFNLFEESKEVLLDYCDKNMGRIEIENKNPLLRGTNRKTVSFFKKLTNYLYSINDSFNVSLSCDVWFDYDANTYEIKAFKGSNYRYISDKSKYRINYKHNDIYVDGRDNRVICVFMEYDFDNKPEGNNLLFLVHVFEDTGITYE